MDEQTIRQIHDLYQQVHHAQVGLTELWRQKTLWTWRWWLCFVGTVAPWIVWVLVRNKRSTHRLLFVALFVMLFSSLMDIVGTAFGLWEYPVHMLPILPPYIPWDLCTLPVVTILFLQYKPKGNPFLKALLYSFLGSFVLESITQALQLYRPLAWRHFYTFAILFVMYLVAHALSKASQFERLTTNTDPAAEKKDG